ncbi:MAG: hypothetical protein ACHP8A_00135 [Terriglobales bacterium]|nr:hypothetical protein [Terriglobales bacterium]
MQKFTFNFYRRTLVVSVFLASAISMFGQAVPAEFFNGLQWRLIGPFRGGRSVAVAGVPGDSTTFYFGAVDGGIWKTTDAGVVWNPIFDGQNVPSIGAIAVAPSDPKIVYAGTGESDIRSDLASGNGVYKSADGGRTWAHIGLEDTRQISRIVVDGNDPNIVYVGALGHAYGPNDQRGVYKSVDGGTHWTKTLDQGPEIGVSDLAICSENPRVLFAGTWHTRRPPWSVYAPIDGPGGGLYRSKDAGKTWSRLNGNGLPEGDWGRIGVAVASDGRRVYALIQAKKPGLYRSDDGGNTWVLENDDTRLTSRPWYFNGITVDPQNRDVIYVPNVALYRSEDGGKTISVLRGAPGGDDYHQIWIDPQNSSSMVLGTDQGTTISLDRGKTWSSWYNQPTAQLYHVITDSKFPYAVYGAQQDSGTAAVFSRTDHGQITPRDWFPAGPSESGYMALDPNDSNIIYVSEAYGRVDRFDRRTGLSQDISPWPVVLPETDVNQRKYRAPWSPVLLFSPADSKSLYFGSQYVMKTVDGGLHWETISPDLTGSSHRDREASPIVASNDNAKSLGYGIISTIAPSSLNRDLIWTGSNSGMIQLTRDGGKTWKDVTPPRLRDWSAISLIEASHFDPAVAYAAVDGSRLDDQTPYLYRTRDYGATWQLITNGIAAPCFLRAISEDPRTKGLLFAGTEFGIYVSFDDGDHWQSLQLNLPVTSVRDLAIHGDDLIVATHGRSFWILDDISPLREIVEDRNAESRAKPEWLYRPAVAVRIDNDEFPGTPLPPEEPTAENPPNGAIIDYFLPAPASNVVLEVFDTTGNLVRKFSSESQDAQKHLPLPVAERWFPKPEALDKTSGMHRFVWDLKWKSSGGPVADEDAWFNNPSGPKVAPGTYQVRLTVDGQVKNQALQVTMDPRSSATGEDLAQQQELGRKIFAETIEPREALAEIDSVKKQLAEIEAKLGPENQQIKSEVAGAQSAMDGLLTNKDAPLEEQNLGLQIAYRRLASALLVVEASDRAIPPQAIALYKEASPQVKAGIAEWKKFKQTRLALLNQQLREASLPALNYPD